MHGLCLQRLNQSGDHEQLCFTTQGGEASPVENRSMADRTSILRGPYRLVVTLTLLLAGCATVKGTGQRALGAVPTAPPRVIYVSRFTFRAEGVSADRGILPISLVSQSRSELAMEH